MRPSAIIFLLLTIFVLHVRGQYVKIKDSQLKNPSRVLSDEIGNYYVLQGSELCKWNNRDTLFNRYSNLQYGDITIADVSNPLKILIYYKEFSRIVFLDNTLSDVKEDIDLQEIGLEQTTLVCTSYDNGLWIYNRIHFELIRFNKNMQELYRTSNLNLMLNVDFKPAYMVEKENKLYVSNPASGIYCFDIFGGLERTIPIKGITKFQVMDTYLIYLENGVLRQYDMKKFEDKALNTPLAKALDFCISGRKLFLLEDNFLKVFRYSGE